MCVYERERQRIIKEEQLRKEQIYFFIEHPSSLQPSFEQLFVVGELSFFPWEMGHNAFAIDWGRINSLCASSFQSNRFRFVAMILRLLKELATSADFKVPFFLPS